MALLRRVARGAPQILAVLALLPGCALEVRLGGRLDADGADVTADAAAADGGVSSADSGAAEDAGTCDESPCRLAQPQCGCPEDRMCQRVTAGSAERSCVAPGGTPRDGACAQSIECTPGHTCLLTAPTIGTCVAWCLDDTPCEGLGCFGLLVAPSEVGSCPNRCDPLAGTGCPAGQACRLVVSRRFVDGALADTVFCAANAGDPQGSACETSLDCSPGLICIGTCEVICDRRAPTCASGDCADLDPSVEVNGVPYGACL